MKIFLISFSFFLFLSSTLASYAQVDTIQYKKGVFNYKYSLGGELLSNPKFKRLLRSDQAAWEMFKKANRAKAWCFIFAFSSGAIIGSQYAKNGTVEPTYIIGSSFLSISALGIGALAKNIVLKAVKLKNQSLIVPNVKPIEKPVFIDFEALPKEKQFLFLLKKEDLWQREKYNSVSEIEIGDYVKATSDFGEVRYGKVSNYLNQFLVGVTVYNENKGEKNIEAKFSGIEKIYVPSDSTEISRLILIEIRLQKEIKTPIK